MNKAVFLIGFRFFGLGVDEEKRLLLKNHNIDLRAIAQLCFDYYRVFCTLNNSGRLAVADPLFITYVVRQKRDPTFDEYVLNAHLNTDPRVRLPMEKLLEILSMVAYVFLLDVEDKVNDIVNGSGYYPDEIKIQVRSCDYEKVEVEFTHVPRNRTTIH